MTQEAGADLDVSPLFLPFRIRGMELRNRFVMPGMQRNLCLEGVPLPELVDHYVRRVEGEVGLIITESCAIDHPSATQNPMFAWMTEKTSQAWESCVHAVKSAGGKMLMQLWHEGAIRTEGGDGPYASYPTISPSGLAAPGKPNGRAASLEDLTALKDSYVRSALLAEAAGFDGVEIHGAHGYLLDQFLWSETNRRTDGYGGDDMAARVRFPAEVVASVRAAVGPDFVITFRFSQWKESDFTARIAQDQEELKVMLDALVGAGVDAFHASTRRFWAEAWEGASLSLAGVTKSLIDKPVIAVGSVGLDVDVMETFAGKEGAVMHDSIQRGIANALTRFANDEFDLLAVGRSLLGDPDWVRKIRQGQWSDIRAFQRSDAIGGGS